MVSSYLPTSHKTLGNNYFKSSRDVPHNKDKVGNSMDEKTHLQYSVCVWMKQGLSLPISFSSRTIRLGLSPYNKSIMIKTNNTTFKTVCVKNMKFK